MITTDQAQQLLAGGGNVVDPEGTRIGSIGQVFLDDQTGEPEWVTVKTGMFGGGESFVPTQQAQLSGNDLHTPYDKNKVKDAPRISDPSGHLSREEESRLYSYYGIEGNDAAPTSTDQRNDRDHDREAVGHDTSGPTTDSAMTRSEEQLHVGTQTHESGRARLRKFVVTEHVTKTVPVSHEEVRLEREPITEANRDEAMTGGDLTTEEHDVVLNQERVVVEKETVPVERVRVDKETVTGQEQVDETVRKEQVELEEQPGVDPEDPHQERGRG